MLFPAEHLFKSEFVDHHIEFLNIAFYSYTYLLICEQPYRAVHKENDLQYVKERLSFLTKLILYCESSLIFRLWCKGKTAL